MADLFASHATGIDAPAAWLAAVTPDDATDLPQACRAINVSASGTVKVTTVAGSTATVYVTAGAAFPVRAARIWATGTTATGIVAMW